MREIKAFIQHIDELESIAPTLASALRGPFAGVAVKSIRDGIMGGEPLEEKNSQKIIQELLSDSRNLEKIREIDLRFQEEMGRIDVDVFSLENPDPKINSGYRGMNPQMIISIVFLIAYFLMLTAIFSIEVSDTLNMRRGENSLMGELQILFGVLTAGVPQILSYWFGGALGRKRSEVK